MNPSIPRWTPAAILLIAGSTQSLAAESPFEAVFHLRFLDGKNGFVINGIDAVDFCGQSVSDAGDVNGDGVDDLIIGALIADPNGQSYAGESYVVFGAAGIGADGPLNFSSLNGSTGFIINGIDTFDRCGRSVSSAGDVNGDGAADLIIGATGADPNGQDSAGESYVVFGGPGVGAGGTFNLSSLNGTNGFAINGVDPSDWCGFSLSNAGDINRDGIDDLIIGTPSADPNDLFSAGACYVVFGRANLCPADLNDDGVIDTADLGGLVGSFGNTSPFADINCDGVVDTADLGLLLTNFGTSCP